MEPSAGDHIVQLGNRTDATRQNAIILSTVGDDAPSIKQCKGINGYTLRNKEVTIAHGGKDDRDRKSTRLNSSH